MIAPAAVATFHSPKAMFIGPPVEVPLASVRTLNVQFPAGITVSFGVAAPPASTIQPRPSGVVLGVARVVNGAVAGRNWMNDGVFVVPVVIVTAVVLTVPDVVSCA